MAIIKRSGVEIPPRIWVVRFRLPNSKFSNDYAIAETDSARAIDYIRVSHQIPDNWQVWSATQHFTLNLTHYN